MADKRQRVCTGPLVSTICARNGKSAFRASVCDTVSNESNGLLVPLAAATSLAECELDKQTVPCRPETKSCPLRYRVG